MKKLLYISYNLVYIYQHRFNILTQKYYRQKRASLITCIYNDLDVERRQMIINLIKTFATLLDSEMNRN
jgi:hypothetical protein